MIEELALIIFGILVGSVLSTEYATWRTKNKIFGFAFTFLDIDPNLWKTLTIPEKRTTIGKSLRKLLKDVFPEASIPIPSPSTLVSLSGNEFFVPKCPECGYAAAPIRSEPGLYVKASCPTHGVFRVEIPETPETKKEESKHA